MTLQRQHIRRILVIDDNPAIHEDFKKILCPPAQASSALQESAARLFRRESPKAAEFEFEVDTALTGQEGVQKVERSLESGKPYSVAFVDVRMPNGWNGLETTRRIWQLTPQLNIVLCTAFSDFSLSEIRQELRQKERFLILKKPFDNIEVQQLAESLSARAEMERRDQAVPQGEALGTATSLTGQFSFDKATGEWRCSRSLFNILGIPAAMVRDFGTLTDQLTEVDRKRFHDAVESSRDAGQSFDMECAALRWSDDAPLRLRARGRWEVDAQKKPLRLLGEFQELPPARH